MKKLALSLALALALPVAPAFAAYDLRGIQLGAAEADVKRALPSAHCKPLEWKSRAADRRCDDSRVEFGGVEVRVTVYLRKDAVEAFDVRFDTRELQRFADFLKSRYGKPANESKDTYRTGRDKDIKERQVYKVVWENGGERAALTAQLEKRLATMLVSRGNFEDEIYRVQ